MVVLAEVVEVVVLVVVIVAVVLMVFVVVVVGQQAGLLWTSGEMGSMAGEKNRVRTGMGEDSRLSTLCLEISVNRIVTKCFARHDIFRPSINMFAHLSGLCYSIYSLKKCRMEIFLLNSIYHCKTFFSFLNFIVF